MNIAEVQRIDMVLREYVKSLCAPIWWESERQTVVNSGTMCVVKTPEALLGITNDHVFEIYERHRAEKQDIFCQLGSAPFQPTDNLIARNPYWDIATFTIPTYTLKHCGHKAFVASHWPPQAIKADDYVLFGGYPEARDRSGKALFGEFCDRKLFVSDTEFSKKGLSGSISRRSVPPGPRPPTMSMDFVSFRLRPHNCSPEQVSFHVDASQVAWLPNVDEPLVPGTSLSGMSGGPCFRIIPSEDRIELGGFIYEGDFSLGIIFARQAGLVSASGQIAPTPVGAG
jgi:hypothetical protein